MFLTEPMRRRISRWLGTNGSVPPVCVPVGGARGPWRPGPPSGGERLLEIDRRGLERTDDLVVELGLGGERGQDVGALRLQEPVEALLEVLDARGGHVVEVAVGDHPQD